MANTMTTAPDGRYLPIQYPEETAYWEAAKEHRLVIPHCNNCGFDYYPSGPVCRKCLSDDVTWAQASGRGHITSFVIYHSGRSPYLKGKVPYAVIQVELDEGPRLTTNFVDGDLAQVKIGLPVEATFDDVTDEVSLVQFRPVSSGGE